MSMVVLVDRTLAGSAMMAHKPYPEAWVKDVKGRGKLVNTS